MAPIKKNDHNYELFPATHRGSEKALPEGRIPLPEKVRPNSWEEFKGIEEFDPHLIEQLSHGQGRPPSLALWGPPGSGKTTFARLVGKSFDAEFLELSAVLIGVKEIREVAAEARRTVKPFILFIDEIHRLNKAQQDAFLPHVESGLFSLIGATTENPSFYLNSALLSRMRLIVFKGLSDDALQQILTRAGSLLGITIGAGVGELLRQITGGDARRALSLLEESPRKSAELSLEQVKQFLSDSKRMLYDRSGEEHYNTISAFIKSMRGSDPDAALYWCFKMIEAGEDPRFIIRRMIIFASEDIGNADPRALSLAISTADAFDRIGLPEGKIPIAHCVTYLASTQKSNRSYLAMHAAIAAVEKNPAAQVPLHLRNAPTKMMKTLGYGEEYQYPHDFDGFVPGEQYLPDQLKGSVFYNPSEQGLEKNIAERLKTLRAAKK